jgi:hypothetical protein
MAAIEQRLRAITGPQHVIITCWCCDRDYAEGSDRYRIDADLLPVCVDENACNWRAVQAGLVPVVGGDAA